MFKDTHSVTFPISRRYDRPVIEIYGVNALIDPGSVFLIIDMDDAAIKKLFGGEYTGYEREVFGVGKCMAKIYMLKHFCIGDMVFNNFPAPVGTLEDMESPIVIGSSMYSRGSKYLVDTESNQITFYFPDVFFRSGKPCIRRGEGWGYLDFDKGDFKALPISITAN